VDPNDANAYANLGDALTTKGEYPEALSSYKEVVRLRPKFGGGHFCLGTVHLLEGHLDDAIREFRVSLDLDPDFPEANCNLGQTLARQGPFQEALPWIRRGHELGSKQPKWSYPSKEWLEAVERSAELESRLDRVLSGELQPRDAAERVEFAQLLIAKSRH